MSVPTKHNTKAILVGTGEFRFCPDATSATDAKLKGYRDFGNIVAFTPEPENTVEEHEGSYRGRKIVDRKFVTKQKLDYILTADEWKKNNLKLLFYASDAASGHLQAALAAHEIDTLAFTSSVKSATDRWYDLYHGSARVRELTSMAFSTAAAVAVTADADTDKITESSHGRNDGDAIVFQGTAAPGGLTLNTVYYVNSKDANTYKVAATASGSAIGLSTTGTDVTVRSALIKDTNYEEDLELGCVRFLTEQAATVYPIVTASAITATDATYFHGLVPVDEPLIEGYGRLIIYDQDNDNEVVMDHCDFPCQITTEKPGAVDGKKPSEFQVRVSITSDMADVGTLWVRHDNDEPA